MNDLILRATAIDHMKSMAGCATYDNYNGVRCRACRWDDAVNIVDELPTIAAILVEWMEAQENIAVKATLAIWRKEQEARST